MEMIAVGGGWPVLDLDSSTHPIRLLGVHEEINPLDAGLNDNRRTRCLSGATSTSQSDLSRGNRLPTALASDRTFDAALRPLLWSRTQSHLKK